MKILAFDKLLPGATLEKIQPHLRDEARHAWQSYKSGVMRELYMRGDRPGAVLIMECDSVEAARQELADLPLVRAGLIEFEIIPLEPFTPFESLMT